ncbi:hypothetical protein AAKU55_003507 [Oxalobacteraceae bacterium GrIS 1.11]
MNVFFWKDLHQYIIRHNRAGLLMGIMLTFSSCLLLALVDFNAAYIVVDSGVVDAKIHGILEWIFYVITHLNELMDVISKVPFQVMGWSEILIFLSPLLILAFSRRVRWLQISIVSILFFGVLMDFYLLFSYDRYNSLNGGGDGMEEFAKIFSHELLGAVSIVLGMAGFLISIVKFLSATSMFKARAGGRSDM